MMTRDIPRRHRARIGALPASRFLFTISGSEDPEGGVEERGSAGPLRKKAGASERNSWMDPICLNANRVGTYC